MKRFIFIIFLVLPTIFLSAQAIVTEQSFLDSLGSLPGLSYAFDVQVVDDGYVLTGATDYPTGAIRHNMRLLKVDKNLNLLWDTTYWKGEIVHMDGKSLQALEDEGFIVAGQDFFLGFAMRISANLDTVWRIQIPNTPNTTSVFEAVAATSDTEFLLGGTVSTTFGGIDAILQKVDLDGQALWTQYYPGRTIQDVEVLPDGTFLTGGGLQFMAEIRKHKANGDTIWTRSLGLSKTDEITDLEIQSDGSIIFAATGSGFAGPIPFVGKLSADGDLLWIGDVSPGLNLASAVASLGQSGVGVAGSLSAFWNDNLPGYFEAFDQEGEKIEGSYEAYPEGTDISSMVVDGDCIILAGTSEGGFYIRKVCGDIINSEDSPEISQHIQIFPVPTSGQLNINLPTEVFLPVNWKLMDAQGRQLRNGIFNNMNNQLDMSQLPAGAYWLQLNHKGQAMAIKRFIKQ